MTRACHGREGGVTPAGRCAPAGDLRPSYAQPPGFRLNRLAASPCGHRGT